MTHSEESTRTPCSSGAQSDGSPLSCLFRSNGETMGSPPEGWPVFVACVFVLHQVFTQNTSAPLRTRSAHPSNLLCRQRHSVPQNNTSPRVTLWPHRGSCCQPCLAKAQHQCPAKDFVFSLKLQRGRSRASRLSGLRLPCQRSVSQSETTDNRFECSYTFTEGGRDKAAIKFHNISSKLLI